MSVRKTRHAFFALDTQRVQPHGQHIILADGKHHIHQLFGAEMFGQGIPGRILDNRIIKQFVGSLQLSRFKFAPAFSLWPLLDAQMIIMGQARGLAHQHMLTPFIFRLGQPADPHDQHLAMFGVK